MPYCHLYNITFGNLNLNKIVLHYTLYSLLHYVNYISKHQIHYK